jgi:hypothetical protein
LNVAFSPSFVLRFNYRRSEVLDYKTGRVAWRKPIAGGGVEAGLLATAGGVLFAGDGSGNFMALDSRTGNRCGIRASATAPTRRKRI